MNAGSFVHSFFEIGGSSNSFTSLRVYLVDDSLSRASAHARLCHSLIVESEKRLSVASTSDLVILIAILLCTL